MANFLITRKLATIALLSALGGLSSLLVGFVGNFLSFLPLGGFISGQLLSGFHVYWLVLAAAIVNKRGAATFAGVLKGAVEMLLPNHLGPFVFVLSLVEGLAVDAVLTTFGRFGFRSFLLAAGISSASNVLVLQVILFPNLPSPVLVGMYLASCVSGIVFGGYLCLKTLNGLLLLVRNESPESIGKEK